MRATIMYGADDVRIENIPDARLIEPTDAVVTVSRACVCGSDLWPYKLMERSQTGRRMGHEAIGIIAAIGTAVRSLKVGELVVMPFAYSDGTCVFCHEGLHTSCVHGGFFGTGQADGAQAEALRVPHAEGTLATLPIEADDPLLPSLLTLSDVMGTGHHAALAAKVCHGRTAAVVGDGAVGLCGVIAAKRLGAEQIIIMGRHPARIALAKHLGATDVVSERGEEAVERVRELTGGFGVHSTLECVGSDQSMLSAIDITRPAAPSAASASPTTSRSSPRSQRSTKTSPSAAGPRRSARTSGSCSPTSSRAGLNLGGCLTGPSASTKLRRATGR